MEKGLTSAGLRFYASKDCHLLLQVTDDCDVDAVMNSANAERTAMSPGGHFSGKGVQVKWSADSDIPEPRFGTTIRTADNSMLTFRMTIQGMNGFGLHYAVDRG